MPFLLKWDRGKDSETLQETRKHFFELPEGYQYSWIEHLLDRASSEGNRYLVVYGFQILGTNAESALPQLENIFMSRKNEAYGR